MISFTLNGIEGFAVFVFGLAIGSFLNAFIYRLEVQSGLRQVSGDREQAGVTVLRGRSFCPSCLHILAWNDLIPLLSFLFLKGKCRYCEEPISWQYPLVELAIAFLFLAIFNFQFSISHEFPILQFFNALYLFILASLFVVIFVYDLTYYLIPDGVVYTGIGIVLLWKVFEFLNLFRISDFGFGIFTPFVQSFLAGLGVALFFFIVYAVSKGRAMGFGDVKLAFLLGLFLGFPSILVALFVAFSVGAVVGLALIAMQKKGLRSEVPFAPFLIIGTAIAFFFSSTILHWYLNLFLV